MVTRNRLEGHITFPSEGLEIHPASTMLMHACGISQAVMVLDMPSYPASVVDVMMHLTPRKLLSLASGGCCDAADILQNKSHFFLPICMSRASGREADSDVPARIR